MTENEQIENIEGNNQTSIFTSSDTGFQSNKWFFTYHIKDDETFEQAFKRLELMFPLCEKYIFAEEYGKSGETPHIQGAAILKNKIRANKLKKDFFKNNVHCPKLKCWSAAFDYCLKEGNNIVTNQIIPKPIKVLEDDKLFPWQLQLIDMCKEDANDRDIYWYWGKQGIGKTQFMKYMIVKYGAIILSGKPSDMKNGVIDYVKNNGVTPNIIFSNIGFDKNLETIHYSGYEDIKDMCFYSGKYEGGMVCGNNPHLIIFANGPPVTTNKKFIVSWVG